MLKTLIEAMERGYLPDQAVRFGIRRLCQERLESLAAGSLDEREEHVNSYIGSLKSSPLAIHTQAANEQHYELPPEFFSLTLGTHRKYSSAFWSESCPDLDSAEQHALQITCERAELKNLLPGMRVLELGCGWGSLTLFMASRYPKLEILAISNSQPQRLYIEQEANKRGFKNIKILTRNINEVFELDREFGKFDRVISVEMFEHLKNYELLFERISEWLDPAGKLFVHIFTHREFAYPFETEGEDNWMGKYFFTGGQMPAHGLFNRFQRDLVLERTWAWSGMHYAKTAEAWLENLDKNRPEVLKILVKAYGEGEAHRWLNRWRVFFMSCAELFGYQNGSQWGVSHYLFENRRPRK